MGHPPRFRELKLPTTTLAPLKPNRGGKRGSAMRRTTETTTETLQGEKTRNRGPLVVLSLPVESGSLSLLLQPTSSASCLRSHVFLFSLSCSFETLFFSFFLFFFSLLQYSQTSFKSPRQFPTLVGYEGGWDIFQAMFRSGKDSS